MLTISMAACAKADGTSPPAKASDDVAPPGAELQTAAEEQGFGEFVQRVQAYVELHRRLEATLPSLPTEASPEAIDAHQRRLGKLIQAERAGARRGDLFTTEAEAAIQKVLARIFGGANGRQLKSSIMDENPVDAKISLNGRYPSQVPLSTVPPQVLASLPKLPPEVEYRFVGDRLILLDTHAYIIADYINNALP